jgi:chromosome segregation ATPase
MSAVDSGKKKRVLLAAEESPSRYRLLTQLHKASLEVDLAANGAIALKKASELNFDAIVIDSALPDIKGEEVIQQARKHKRVAEKPIFLCTTASAVDGLNKRAAKLGITQAFDKEAAPEITVAEMVTHIGYTNVRPVASRGAGATQPRKGNVPDMPEDLKNFEFFKPPAQPNQPNQKSNDTVPVHLMASDSNSDAPSNDAAKTKYWQAKVQELGVENMKLQERLTNLQRERDHLAVLMQTEGGEQLQRAKAAAEAAELAREAEAGRVEKLESELSQLRLLHERLNSKVAEETRVSAETKRHNEFLEQQIAKHNSEIARVRSEYENRAAEVTSTEADLTRQLAQAKATAENAEAACKQEGEKAARFQAELARLLQARAELNGKFTETQRHNETLVKDLERLKAEHAVSEAQLRQQVEAAKAAAQSAQAAFNEETNIFSRSQEKVNALQRERDELNARLAGEQQTVTSLKRLNDRLEEQLRDSVAQVTRLKSELELRATERSARENELVKQLAAAKTASEQAEASAKEATARAARLESELAPLRHVRTELSDKLAAEQRAAAEARQHAQEQQRAWAEAVRELERVKRELQQHKTEMASGIREELQVAQSAVAQAKEELAVVRRTKDDLASRIAGAEETADCAQNAYKREMARADRLEKELISLRKVRTQLTERLKDEESEAERSKLRVKELEERVSRSVTDLDRARSELDKQMVRRQRLGETGAALPAELAAMDKRVRDSVNALERATTDLEKERRKIESAASQSRIGSAEIARVGKAYLNSYRSQLRGPADSLISSIRRLVSLSLDQDQRKLAEAALEHAVVLQTKLSQEPVLSPDLK